MSKLFFMQVYKDQRAALRSIRQLRSVYPDAIVIVRSDGGGGRCRQHFEKLGVKFFSERRRFTYQYGGYCVHRMLHLWAQHNTPFLFKIDPDTYVRRQLGDLSHFKGIFGTHRCINKAKVIQGGCVGFTRAAARRLFKSRILLHKKLVTLEIPHRYRVPFFQRRRKFGLSSFDWSIAWAAWSLGIPLENCPEISCRHQRFPYDDGTQAILHPWTKWKGKGNDT